MAAASIRRPSLLTDSQMRELTGLSLRQFGGLLAEVGPEWEAAREARLSAPERQRVFGAGRKHDVPFAGRLITTLVYLRWNVSFRMLAATFGSNKDTLQRVVAEIAPLLAAHGITAPEGARLGDDAALPARLRALSKHQRAALVVWQLRADPPARQGWLGGAEGPVLAAPAPPCEHVPGGDRRSRWPVVGR